MTTAPTDSVYVEVVGLGRDNQSVIHCHLNLKLHTECLPVQPTCVS